MFIRGRACSSVRSSQCPRRRCGHSLACCCRLFFSLRSASLSRSARITQPKVCLEAEEQYAAEVFFKLFRFWRGAERKGFGCRKCARRLYVGGCIYHTLFFVSVFRVHNG